MAPFQEEFKKFTPTPESIPPPVVNYSLQQPKGLPVNFHPLNPLAFVIRAAQRAGYAPAIAHPNVAHPVYYTYRVFLQRIQNLAYALVDAGVKPGQTVAVIAPNCPMIAEAHHGIPAARAVICTVNTRLTPHEIAYIIDHSQAVLILIDHELVGLLPPADVLAKKGIKVVVSNDTGRAGDPYEEFLSAGRRASRESGWSGLQWEADENTAISLSYTSGTTGRPKGVITTLRGTWIASVGAFIESNLSQDSIYLWVLPMFHVNGWQYPWAMTIAGGLQITLRAVLPSLIWFHLLNSDVTHFCSAPTVQIALLSAPEARTLPKKVMTMLGGAAPTAKLVGEMDRVGMIVVHGYGLTETHGPSVKNYPQPHWATLSLEDRARLIARQGISIIVGDDVRVVKPLGEAKPGVEDVLEEVKHDGKEVGEVVMRGNTVMREYFRDPAATREAFRGGYFHSGDLAVIYPDGNVSIQDRSKDIIISGGENASSLAIETALSAHPDVLELTAVARPHPKWGERPMVFVILRPDAREKWRGREGAFEEELKRFSRDVLAGFERPEWVRVVDELPKTSTGKIQKHELRKIAAKL